MVAIAFPFEKELFIFACEIRDFCAEQELANHPNQLPSHMAMSHRLFSVATIRQSSIIILTTELNVTYYEKRSIFISFQPFFEFPRNYQFLYANIYVVNSSWRQKCIRFIRHWIILPTVASQPASQPTIDTIAHTHTRQDELNKKCMHFYMRLVWMHHMLWKSWVKNHYYKNGNKKRHKWVGYAERYAKKKTKKKYKTNRDRAVHIRLKCAFGFSYEKFTRIL